MGTDLYGPSVNIFDPLFGATWDDSVTAPQMAMIALGSVPGSMDSYPDFGFPLERQIGRALDATALAMLPQEMQAGLLSEPAFTDASVQLTGATDDGDGGVSLAAAIAVTGATGDAIGFTLATGG